MTNLRKEAKGRECQVRIVGVCNGNPETVVLAHYRMGGLNGMGMKPDDIFGAWACSACHDAVDGRTKTKYDCEQLRLFHEEGVFRTQAVGISVDVTMPDNRARDLDNLWKVLLDSLSKAKIIEDDCWQKVLSIAMKAVGVSKENAGVVVTIEEV